MQTTFNDDWVMTEHGQQAQFERPGQKTEQVPLGLREPCGEKRTKRKTTRKKKKVEECEDIDKIQEAPLWTMV